MTSLLFALLRLLLGTLYPAFASFKAVRTKNVREYVKWMMYWIVFALFTATETLADVLVAFWMPCYYEAKLLLLLWLISPVSRGSLGSSIVYRKLVHPQLMRHEDELDNLVERLKRQSYSTASNCVTAAFNYATQVLMHTALRAPDWLASARQQLQQSQSAMSSPLMSSSMTSSPKAVDIVEEAEDAAEEEEDMLELLQSFVDQDELETSTKIVKKDESSEDTNTHKNRSKRTTRTNTASTRSTAPINKSHQASNNVGVQRRSERHARKHSKKT